MDPLDLVGPESELTVEIPFPVANCLQASGLKINAVDSSDLFDHAVAHSPNTGGVGGQLDRHLLLVDVSRQSLHGVELPAEHLPRRLEPQRLRRSDRRGLEPPKNVELALQVIGLEETRRRWADPEDHVFPVFPAGVIPSDREIEGLGGMPQLSPAETFRAYILCAGQVRRYPPGETSLRLHQRGVNRMRMRS